MDNSTKYDVIVVGGGSAGAVVAARLSEDERCKVLLLEGGPDYASAEALPGFIRYGYGPSRFNDLSDASLREHLTDYAANVSSEGPAIGISAGTVIGGGSSVNAQIFLRAEPADFAAWSTETKADWSFESVLPFYRKCERDLDFDDPWHGRLGPIPVKRFSSSEWHPHSGAFFEACRAFGFAGCLDHNAPGSTGIGATPRSNDGMVRVSTAIGYLLAARARPNLRIVGRTTVSRIIFQGSRAVGVEAIRNGHREKLFGEQVVLSAGAIGSPKLLQLSGVGPGEQLRKLGIDVVSDCIGVGGNLHDHPQAQLTWTPRPSVELDPEAARIQVTLRYTARDSKDRNDMLMHPVSYALGSESGMSDMQRSAGLRLSCSVNHAHSTGRLSLRSADPDDAPVLDMAYLTDRRDFSRLAEAITVALELSCQRFFVPILGTLSSPDIAVLSSREEKERWIRRSVFTSYHLTGTCSMGPSSSSLAVVDHTGAVHGLQNLAVIDASVIPVPIRANTNATTIMLAERMVAYFRRQTVRV